jgi:hypothetical protein
MRAGVQRFTTLESAFNPISATETAEFFEHQPG